MNIIQIQETQGKLFGKARNLRLEYRFMREEEEDTDVYEGAQL
jgi:hypothetical protein